MKKVFLVMVLVAGTILIGMSTSSAADGQFRTNHTVSVPAGQTVTYTRSCNESSSHSEGGVAVGGSAEFNETNSENFLSVVSEGITGDGTGYFTQVKNTADRGYAYLSWATCDPIPVVDEPVVEPPVVDEPVVEPPVVDEPVVEPPVVDEPITMPPKTEKPKTVVKKRVVTIPKASQPVSEQGVLPNTGGLNALYITAGVVLLVMGSTIVLFVRKDRHTN